jgi:hypothetical protein
MYVWCLQGTHAEVTGRGRGRHPAEEEEEEEEEDVLVVR